MNVIEFQSAVQDGVIKLPERYRNRRLTNVRVIVFDNPLQTIRKKKVSFTDFGLTMPAGYKFDREEANER
jgi:hypothetical protein